MNIKYMGENAISYLIEKCKSTFALITHKHTAQEVGADVEGSASAALVLAQQHTDEQIATHEHSWNDLEDKPFYTSYVENVLLEEIEVFVYKAGIWAWISENQFILEEGKTYKVVFNGVTYECVAYSSVYGVVIGNLAPMGLSSGNNEPFAIRSQNLCTASGGTYTVSVAELQENFVTLSEDFIPDTIARTEYVDENFALKSDLANIDLSKYETKTDAQLKYDELVATKADKEHTHSWNDLEDKPFYETIVEGEVLCEFNAIFDSNEPAQVVDCPIFDLTEGESYQVIIDGIEYEPTVCKEIIDYHRYKVLGNSTLYSPYLGENSGEDYTIVKDVTSAGGAVFCFAKGKANQNSTIRIIEGKTKEIVPIDEKFLPDSIARTTYVDENFALKSDLQNIDLSSLETKEDSQSKLDEAKAYADSAASTVKDDLLNGAGDAYDTLLELGELIDENHDAIEALETVATGKADKDHDHEGVYEEVGSIELAKAEIKAYVDEALASRIVVQMHTWEADD